MFGKYKTPIFLIIFSFLIQFLGHPVPSHEPPKIANTPFDYLLLIIAIHRKFQTRRVAEDSTRLYGEAAQHRMRLSVDGYISGGLSFIAIIWIILLRNDK